jgi:hypothetical protein
VVDTAAVLGTTGTVVGGGGTVLSAVGLLADLLGESKPRGISQMPLISTASTTMPSMTFRATQPRGLLRMPGASTCQPA